MSDEERIRLADRLRQVILDDCKKAIRQTFKKYKPLRSIGLLVAQYWDDEADDAVHGRFIYSELETPDTNAALATGQSRDRDHVNLPSFTKKRSPPYLPSPWDSNGASIPAFAAYCTEGGDQNGEALDNYSLVAVFSKGGDVKIVGPKVRPHLDGHPEQAMVQALARVQKR